jgi:hypothetical protein
MKDCMKNLRVAIAMHKFWKQLFRKKSSTIKLTPTGLLQTIQIIQGDGLLGDDWMITRQFLKNDEPIYVKGFGRNRAEAYSDFEAELELEQSC